MIPLIRELFDALDREGILYCHWKSNAFLDQAVRGEDDLDLLVGRAHRPAFLAVLKELGFKEARVRRRSLQVAGVHDHYGHEETDGRLVHVHAHDLLVVGHDTTKNYHLPIEEAYLQSAARDDHARVPAPEFEWVVLVVRLILKHSTWNTVLNGQGRLSTRERREMEFLRERVNPGQAEKVLSRHLPFLKPDLWKDCLSALEIGCPLGERIRAGHRLQAALRDCRLRPAAVDNWLQLWRRLKAGVGRRLFGEIPEKRLADGGRVAAFVGGDGAGKSTVIDGMASWLSPPFALTKVHMGKPAWSLTTIVAHALLKVGCGLGLYPYSRVPPELWDAGGEAGFPGYPTLIRSVCTARDRYLAYRIARRRASRGEIVICDRFPMPHLTFLDGPEIERVSKSRRKNWLIGVLGVLERRYYRLIPEPDLLFVLRADPETAIGRKPEEDAAYVRSRTKEFGSARWEASGAIVIDAEQPLTEVLKRARALLWARL